MPKLASFVVSVAFAVAAADLAAQSYVSPAHFATAEGATNNTFPFGFTTPLFRYAQIHDDVPAMTISGIAFRHDSSSAGAAIAPFSVTISAWVSTATHTSATADPTFDNNHGPDKLQVVTARTITFPANDPASLPGAFVCDIPFDVPFGFAGNGASLCWEVQITARTNPATVSFDAVNVGVGVDPALASTRAFTGCRATGRSQPITAAPVGSTMNWPGGTGALAVTASNLPASAAMFWALGFDHVAWNGSPLPLAVPGSAVAPSGRCDLLVDVASSLFATASSTGAATLSATYGVNPTMHGLTIWSQAIALDAAANPFGVVTSNLAGHQLVAPYALTQPVCRIYLGGSLGAVGTASTGAFLITKFY